MVVCILGLGQSGPRKSSIAIHDATAQSATRSGEMSLHSNIAAPSRSSSAGATVLEICIHVRQNEEAGEGYISDYHKRITPHANRRRRRRRRRRSRRRRDLK
jgi:hypothetical protein